MAYPNMLEFCIVFKDLNAEDENTAKKVLLPLGLYDNMQQAVAVVFCENAVPVIMLPFWA